MKVRPADRSEVAIDAPNHFEEFPRPASVPRILLFWKGIADLETVERAQRRVAHHAPGLLVGMGGDRDTALRVDGSRRLFGAQPPVDPPRETGSRHVKSRRGDLLTD